MKSFRDFITEQESASQPSSQPSSYTPPSAPATPVMQTAFQPRKKKWSASKNDIIAFWRNLRSNSPIQIKPIQYQHKGSTYGEDGIRITGSPQFITSVISKLKDFLGYEGPNTKLAISYRETESPSKSAAGQSKTSFVFYIAVKERGHQSY